MESSPAMVCIAKELKRIRELLEYQMIEEGPGLPETQYHKDMVEAFARMKKEVKK